MARVVDFLIRMQQRWFGFSDPSSSHDSGPVLQVSSKMFLDDIIALESHPLTEALSIYIEVHKKNIILIIQGSLACLARLS